MNKTLLSTALIALLGLNGCGTLNGAGQDFQNWGGWLDRNFGDDRNSGTSSDEPAPVEFRAQAQANQAMVNEPQPVGEPLSLRADADCPQINVLSNRSAISEFEDPANPRSEAKISSAKITRVQPRCLKNAQMVSVALNINIAAEVGPKGRLRETDKPFFSFPYYVVVKDSNGRELAREVFSATVSFEAGESNKSITETIEQNLPLDASGMLGNFVMEVGFELTEQQLSYNNNTRTFF
ncbi:MAG: hypothetical protein AAF988_06545 [Pseudomonadota bacterium]